MSSKLQFDVRFGGAVWWMLTGWRPGVVDWGGGVVDWGGGVVGPIVL